MKEACKVFGFFSAVFAVAFGAQQMLVADIVPVAYADVPQPLWAVGTAVVLRALELISGSLAFIALILMCGVLAEHLRQVQDSTDRNLTPQAVPVENQPQR